jgi:hypothetical protein
MPHGRKDGEPTCLGAASSLRTSGWTVTQRCRFTCQPPATLVQTHKRMRKQLDCRGL